MTGKAPNIHPYTDAKGKTRYAVCVWVERAAQFQAPLDAEDRRLTGCHTEFARTAKGIGGHPDLGKARRRARKLYGYSKLAR
jgi:hypothetical protein